mgnify:CR=1 FL=1
MNILSYKKEENNITPISIVTKWTINGIRALEVMSNNPQETTNDSIYRTPTDRLTCLTQPIALHAVAIGLSAHETNDSKTII